MTEKPPNSVSERPSFPSSKSIDCFDRFLFPWQVATSLSRAVPLQRTHTDVDVSFESRASLLFNEVLIINSFSTFIESVEWDILKTIPTQVSDLVGVRV